MPKKANSKVDLENVQNEFNEEGKEDYIHYEIGNTSLEKLLTSDIKVL